MMRILFAVLLLANVAAFVWFEWLDQPNSPTPAASPLPDVQPLELLTELTPSQHQALVKAATPAPAAPLPPPPATTRAAVSATTIAAAAAAAPACMSYGPFPSAEAMQAGTARLQKAGASVRQQLVPGKVKLGYWVYLPPFGSRHEADAAAALLKQRGVKDIYVVSDDINRDAISLGVFSQRQGAAERQQRIRKLGLHPVLAERFRDSPRYWLDARGQDSQLPAASVFADLGEDDAAVGRQPVACGTPAANH